MENFNRDKYIFSDTPAIVDITQKVSKQRQDQISIMIKELFLYKVLLKDLVGHTPNKSDKNLILNVAYYIVENVEFLDILQEKRELPIDNVAKKTRVSKTFLDTWQDYIIAYCIILSNVNYKGIQDYIRIEYNDKKSIISLEKVKKTVYRGIVLKTSRNSAIILTSNGEFIKVKDSNSSVGEEVQAKEKKGFKHYKIQICIGACLLVLFMIGIYNQYNKSVRTIIIKTNSQVKYEVNSFDKVIYAYSPTDSGKDIINYVEPIDKNIDNAIQKHLEYLYDNRKEKTENVSVVITVTGKALKYGSLTESGNYILDKKGYLDVLINNAGNEHKLYESTLGEKEDKEDTNDKKQ